MIKFFLLLCALVASLTACGSSTPSAEKLSVTKSVDLTGNWSTAVGVEPNMKAAINDDTIDIQWIHEGTSALYWVGTLPNSKSVNNSTTLTSAGDTVTMDAALLASGAASKDFTYNDKKIAFKFVIMGVTQTLYFEKA